jgi:hypothetical protein
MPRHPGGRLAQRDRHLRPEEMRAQAQVQTDSAEASNAGSLTR